MKKNKKRNVLNQIDDAINDKIDEIKAKNQKKRQEKYLNKHKDNNKKDKYKKDNKNYQNKSKNYYKSNNKYKDNNKEKKEKKKKRSIFKKILTAILILAIIGILSVAAFLGYIVITAPEFNESDLSIKDQTVIYDINGNVVTTLGAEKRESITYDELPQVLIDAIIATEDARFFQHNGVDLFRFIKATIQQFMGHDEAGGASTLTMQTVKNNLTKKDTVETSNTLEGKIKKVIRKFQDVYLAVFKVEKQYSKEEILEIYVNDNGLGSSYYGVEEAAKYYFGKSVSGLTLPEAAMIAGLFQAPNRHNPYYDIESATSRRNTVLNLMLRHGYITKEEKELAEKVPIESLLVGVKNADNAYQGYIDTVVAEVEKLTDRGDGTGGDNPYTVPMKIYTTMERSIQEGLNKIFTATKKDKWYWKDEYVQAGVAIVNAETGAIAAVGAGRNKTGVNQFNYATQALRQPGSTAKPIFDYGPAIEYLNYSTFTLVNDEPWGYSNGVTVHNWDNGYEGLKTIRRHLQVSRNIPALKAFQQVGAKNSQKFAYSLGLDVSLNSESENYRVLKNGLDNTINEAYAIGGVAEGFTPLTMASAYAAFANGGYYTSPYTVTKIEYRETGEIKEFKNPKTRVMKDSTAYIMNNILESATTNGFHGGARVNGSHVATKTGTTNFDAKTIRDKHLPSNAVNDIWTIAYTSKYSVAVWYGYDVVTSTTYNTNNAPKEALVGDVMSYIPKDTKGWSMPSSVVAVEVEKDTVPAKLPSQYTPSDMRSKEYFVRGTQPTEISERFQKLNDVTNVNTSINDNIATITWSYTTPEILTDAYLQKYFSDSTFGKEKTKYLNQRKADYANRFGDVGFGIYMQEEDGTQTLIDFTKDYSYTYQGYGDVTLIIKAEYQKFKSNASSGIKTTLNLGEPNVKELIATLNGKTSVTYNVGEYQEAGFKSIYYGNIDVTNAAKIVYQVTENSNTLGFNSQKELENHMNTLPAGEYKITYGISYLGLNALKNRRVTLKDTN